MLVSPDVDGAKAYLESNGVPVFSDIERHGVFRAYKKIALHTVCRGGMEGDFLFAAGLFHDSI